MKTLITLFILISVFPSYATVTADQFPSSGEQLLQGCKLILEIELHDCKNGDCAKHSLPDCLKAVATFNYVRGFLNGVRTLQVVEGVPRIVNFPEEGVDCTTLIKPLVEFLQNDPTLLEKHSSIGLYLFLAKKYPKQSK